MRAKMHECEERAPERLDVKQVSALLAYRLLCQMSRAHEGAWRYVGLVWGMIALPETSKGTLRQGRRPFVKFPINHSGTSIYQAQVGDSRTGSLASTCSQTAIGRNCRRVTVSDEWGSSCQTSQTQRRPPAGYTGRWLRPMRCVRGKSAHSVEFQRRPCVFRIGPIS